MTACDFLYLRIDLSQSSYYSSIADSMRDLLMKAVTCSFITAAFAALTISFLSLEARAQTCINNPYPGYDTFCLTFEGNVRTLDCGVGMTSICDLTIIGPFVWGSQPLPGLHQVRTLALTCKPNQAKANYHWSLTCLSDGSLCNVNDKQLCCGKSTFNVGDSCTHF